MAPYHSTKTSNDYLKSFKALKEEEVEESINSRSYKEAPEASGFEIFIKIFLTTATKGWIFYFFLSNVPLISCDFLL